MTLPHDPYTDTAAAGPTPGPVPPAAPPGRAVTEPMRHFAATALLAGNGVLLFLGVSDLLFVVSSWASGFGIRSEAVFSYFAGPVAVALPLLAMLLATHVSPALPQARAILVVALVEYAVSALFGVITYFGAFVNGIFTIRATFDGLIGRAVWLAFLTIAATAVWRVFRKLYPPPPPQPAFSYAPTVYGRPYPGQPSYPRPTHYRSAAADPAGGTSDAPTAQTSAMIPTQPIGAQPRVVPPQDSTAPAETTQPMPPVVGGAPER